MLNLENLDDVLEYLNQKGFVTDFVNNQARWLPTLEREFSGLQANSWLLNMP